MTTSRITRRKFVAAAAASSFAFTYIPRRVWGANERFYVAGIGVGGKGAGEVTDITQAGGTFVALCDVDAIRAAKTIKSLPQAKVYQDFRVMLEKEKGIDAVSVSTPDHTHAVAALTAMAHGKHVYCQKPLTQTIHEARLMAQAAEYYKVQTQMGNQAHAGEPIRRAVELVRAGIIGPVREVHAWTNRPIWPQGQAALAERSELANQAKPADLNWDCWLGPASQREFNACYVPFKWRGWWDFGTGALGDMACHIMDMPYWALDLGSPQSVEAESAGGTSETGPDWSTIVYQFAARESVGGGDRGGAVGPKAVVEQPAVKFVWYDGVKDSKANGPHALLDEAIQEAGLEIPVDGANERANKKNKKNKERVDDPRLKLWDLMLVGDHGKMLFNRASTTWTVTPKDRAAEFAEIPMTIPRVDNEDAEWVAACRGASQKPLSSFDYSGPFTEMVLLGTVAIRSGQKVTWDAKNMKTNSAEADQFIQREYRKGWELPAPPKTRG